MKRTLLALLFACTALPAVPPARAEEAPQAPAAAQPRRHRLVGVILSSAQALLWDEESGEYALRRVGDPLMGGRIGELGEDYLVIDRGETQEELVIAAPPQRLVSGRRTRRLPPMVVRVAVPPATAAAAAVPPPAVPASPPVAAVPPPVPALVAPPPAPVVPATPPPEAAVVPAPPGTPDPQADPNATPPPGTVMGPWTLIPRSHLDQELNNAANLTAQVALAPNPGGGFRLTALQPGSFLDRAGLRPGDVVLRIDGRPINNVADATAAVAWLRLTDHFSVDILRDGHPLMLRFAIQSS